MKDKLNEIVGNSATSVGDATKAMSTWLIKQIDEKIGSVVKAADFIVENVDNIAEKITTFTEKIMSYIFSSGDYVKGVMGTVEEKANGFIDDLFGNVI